MDDEQGGKCWICLKPDTKMLAVDHIHRVKVMIMPNPHFQGNETPHQKKQSKYMGEAELGSKNWYVCFGPTKTATLKTLKKMYQRDTVRGLLCSSCNRVLGKVENPRWKWGPEQLRRAADYLEKFQRGRFNGKASGA